jgi:hypothetical protein
VQTNQFGFYISWVSGKTVAVDSCMDMANPIWTPVGTNTVAEDGSTRFSDPQQANQPIRFYRLRAQ